MHDDKVQMYRAHKKSSYYSSLERAGLIALVIYKTSCPECERPFALRIPPDPPLGELRFLCCPYVCSGEGIPIDRWVFREGGEHTFNEFDLAGRHCAYYAVDGWAASCPVDGVINILDIFRHATNRVDRVLIRKGASRSDLEDAVRYLISAYDGTMREAVRIAQEWQKGHPDPCEIPDVHSFQNLKNANRKLELAWLQRCRSGVLGWLAADHEVWDPAYRLFQKRHLLTHSLGVVDQKYLDNSGDAEASIGKRVPLSIEEVREVSDLLERYVQFFCGNWLS